MENVQVAEEEVHIQTGEVHSSSVAEGNSFFGLLLRSALIVR